nr:HTH domain-containing protein [Metabacillus sediminilitoris]
MSKIIFTEMQMNQLEVNPNVVKVSERSITYHPEFKIKAAIENLEGKDPLQIFIENGFDVDVIGREKPQQCLDRWKKTYRE